MSLSWAASTLSWWSDAGVDVIVGEEPRDWLTIAPKAARKASATAPPAKAPLPAELEQFQAWLMSSTEVPGAAPSAPRLGPAGNPEAAIMVLTDFPTLKDFSSGRLISSQGLFDKMLGAIQLSRENIYLASLSPLRPPTGTLPPEALRRWGEIARHHIALVAPKAVLLLGDVCAKVLVGSAVNQSRSKWHEIETNGARFRALVTLKPEQLSLQPNLKKLAWSDLQMLNEGIAE